MLRTPAVIRFVSYEPALSCLGDVTPYIKPCNEWETHHINDYPYWLPDYQIDCFIAGGESGPNSRPMHPDWVRSLRDQCADAGKAFFFKQWGDWVSYIDREVADPDWRQNYSESKSFRGLNLEGGCGFHGERYHHMQRIGKKAAGRLLDGVEHNELPCVAHG